MIEFQVGKNSISIDPDKVIRVNGLVVKDHSLAYVGEEIVGIHDDKNSILYSKFKKDPIKTVELNEIKL